jgi:hypothetical protein
MRYDEARSLIDTGDLIAVRRKDSLLALATRFFTHGPHTHVGIALWVDEGLWMAELNGGGNHLVPLSQLTDFDFDVYRRPPEVSEAHVVKSIFSNLREKIEYGTAALFAIGLLNWIRLKVSGRQRRILVCSGYCVSVYVDAGWSDRTRLISPEEFANMLEFKLAVRKGGR